MARDFGKFKHYITVERRDVAQDSQLGSPVDTWSNLCGAYAHIRGVGGREIYVQGPNKPVALATHLVTFRWPGTDVRPTDRIRYEGRVFNITRVSNVEEADKFVEALVSEVQN